LPLFNFIGEYKMPRKKGKAVKLVTLCWPHPVDLSNGMEARAYGIKLVADEDGNYTGDMPEARAEVELTRSGRAFVEALAEVEAPLEDDETLEDGDEPA